MDGVMMMLALDWLFLTCIKILDTTLLSISGDSFYTTSETVTCMHKGISTRGGPLGLLGLMIYRILDIQSCIHLHEVSYEYNYNTSPSICVCVPDAVAFSFHLAYVCIYCQLPNNYS